MRTSHPWYSLAAILLVFFQTARLSLALSQDATDIVRKADQHAKGKTSVAEMTIQTIRPTWKREMHLKTWTKGNELVMILVTAPVKDKGITFLKNGKEIWNWIPGIERHIKLPPSMMSQSWMGTDFTNDDLVKESSVVEDYHHQFSGDSVIEQRSCYKITMIPKPEAAVVWGKVELWIDKKDYMMLRATYYDEDGSLVNTLQCSEIKMLGGKWLPSKMEMWPEDKKGNRTVLIYRSIVFDQPIENRFFTSSNMSKVK